MTAILGLNAFHADSAACLVVDGKLKGAVAEERLGDRVKHSSAFPANAIRQFVTHGGISGHFEISFDENNKLIAIQRIG